MVVSDGYRQIGAAAVAGLFADARTHTNDAGAQFNARSVIAALNGLPRNPAAAYLSAQGKAVPPATAHAESAAAPAAQAAAAAPGGQAATRPGKVQR